MNSQKAKSNTIGIPQQINEQFLKQLEAEKLPADVIGRLKELLHKEGGVSEVELEKALFPKNEVA